MISRDDAEKPDFAALTTRVYRLCRALLGDGGLASEASQEALMRAWQHRGRRRNDVSWWTWVAGFAIRVCRESRRRPATASFSLDDVAAAHPTDGDENGADRGRLATVYRAIGQLPDRQREVVVLRFLLGHSVETSAQALSCPAGTVKSNLHKAVRRLRAIVVDLGPNHGL